MAHHTYPAGIYDLSAYEDVSEHAGICVEDGYLWGSVEVDHYPNYVELQAQIIRAQAALPSSLMQVMDRQDPARGRIRLRFREPGALPTYEYKEMLRGVAQGVRVGWGGV